MKILKNLSNLHVFLIGVGGISMSGLARILLSQGASVSGSDIIESSETKKLGSMGARIFIGHSADSIDNSIDLVVYSGAIHDDNPELNKAKSLEIAIMERSEFLGLISKQFNHVIAISGTHGKTTTTAILGEIFKSAGLNPTIHLGGVSVNLGTNTYVGDDEYLIVEACEYRNSFRYLNPDCAVITNIESDHLDFYKDLDEIEKAFQSFANNSNKVVINSSVKISHRDIITIGEDFEYKNLKFQNRAYNYDVYYQGEFFCNITLNMIGIHNVINSLYAIAVSKSYGIDKNVIIEAIKNFKGVERRYEKIHNINQTPIIIDYAHHPTEIKNSIAGIETEYKNILCVFQPHTYSRTLKLFNEFVDIFKNIKNLILFQTYPAREEIIIGGRAEDLFDALPSPCSYISEINQLIDEIENTVNEKNIDCVLVLGAGDLADKLKNYYKNNIVKK